MDESREIARAAVAEGISTIAATPHVRGDFPTSVEAMEKAVENVIGDLAEHEIPLAVVHGGEIALDRLSVLEADDLERFTLGQTGVYLLLEMPDGGWPLALEATVVGLRENGIVAASRTRSETQTSSGNRRASRRSSRAGPPSR